jgi:dihydroxyacid dehydratase/phosphogluconate dehydratase
MAMTDNASIPAVDARRHVLCERAGARAGGTRQRGPRPSEVMTKPAFENAIRVMHAIGGSTNTVIHMLALAGRLGVDLTLDDFGAGDDVPVLANLRPSGDHLLEAFFHAGGVPALMGEMGDLLHQNLPTVTGTTVEAERLRPPEPESRRDPLARRSCAGPGARSACCGDRLLPMAR